MKLDTNHFSNSNENQNVTFEELHIRHLNLLVDLKIKKLKIGRAHVRTPVTS